MDNSYDIIIIGAGVTGCAIARELSKYEARILVVEKDEDVCTGTSKANSGIVHAGYDAKPGTLSVHLLFVLMKSKNREERICTREVLLMAFRV